MISSLRMTILCEDQARLGFLDRKFSGQHGLSIFIEAGANILLDVGPSDVTVKNAELADVNLGATDTVVLSHGHWDHTDGLPALAEMGIRPPVLAHPEVFADRHKATGEYNGAGVGRQWVADTFGLTESRDPVELAPDVWFLGEVPRNNDFEARTTTFFQLKDGERTPDFLMDDTALALRTTKGLVVVTGCSHAGICNICEHAREVCGDARLHMVMGGFHLLDDSPVLERTIEYFRSHNVERLLPMHCTALPALARMWMSLGAVKPCAGDVVKI